MRRREFQKARKAVESIQTVETVTTKQKVESMWQVGRQKNGRERSVQDGYNNNHVMGDILDL